MMRKGFLISIAAVAGISGSAVAADLSYPTTLPPSDSPVYSPAPMVTGHLELGLGVLSFDIDELGFLDASTFGLATAFGRANVPLFGGTWNFEAEIGGIAVFDDGDTASSLEGIGHFWFRSPAYSGGVFVGATAFDGIGIGTVGVEGEAYFGSVTIGGQGSYNWSDDFDELLGSAATPTGIPIQT